MILFILGIIIGIVIGIFGYRRIYNKQESKKPEGMEFGKKK